MKLADWLARENKTQAAFAPEIDVTPGRVSQLVLHGTDSLAMALRIERATDGAVTAAELMLEPRAPATGTAA